MALWFEESIPVDKAQFTKILRSSLPEAEGETFDHFAKLFDHYCNYKFRNILNQLHSYYQPFNPNTCAPISLKESEEQHYARHLIYRFKRFLEQAQYEQMGEYDIRDILKQSKSAGIELGFPSEKYQEFLVYFRDPVVLTEYYRSLRSLWLRKHRKEVWYYKRLTILVHPFRKTIVKSWKENFGDEMRNVYLPQPITLKLFQDIRQDYLPIIFPGIFLKLTFFKKLSLVVLFLISLTAGITISSLSPSPWYGFFGMVPLLLFLYELWEVGRQKKQHYRALLAHLYHKNIGSNSGVLSYLNDRIAEETYKLNFLVLYAFWKKSSWAFHPISMESLVAYLQKFMLEYFGIQMKLSLENVLPELLLGSQIGEYTLSPLLQTVCPTRSYLKYHGNPEATFVDVEETNVPLLQSGVIHIAPGTESSEKRAFFNEKFFVYVQEEGGLKFSHAPGSVVRWIMQKPFRTKLLADTKAEEDYLTVLEQNLDQIPLKGMGKVLLGDKNFEFRYHRKRGENKLYFDAGLRYRHSIQSESQVLVRPVLPSFVLKDPLEAPSFRIDLPADVVFPETGLLKIRSPKTTQFIYYRRENGIPPCLLLSEATKESYQAGSMVSLTPPVATLKTAVKKGSSFLPLHNTQHFSKRGILIIGPDSESEERVTFRGETLRLALNRPLLFAHQRGSLVVVKGTIDKSKIITKAPKNANFITIQGFSEEINAGEIIIDPGELFQEIRSFTTTAKSLELTSPTKFKHPEGCEVWEARLESPLRYEAFQGSPMITVEDASAFPLSGILEIHFNGTNGVKEVFPFLRTQCSNTLILKAQPQEVLKKESEVIITAVEVVTETALHYHEKVFKADFSFVPDFPEQGNFVIEPGSQTEENITFQRYPTRMHLGKPLQYFHAVGTVIDFTNYMQCETKEALHASQDRVQLDFQHLLPERGCLDFLSADGQKESVWYRKLPRRIILNDACRFHHSKGEGVLFPTISKNLTLAAPIERGDQQIKLQNARELPEKGKIKIEGILFHEIVVDFIRTDDTLYLKESMPHSFSIHATISIPEIYLHAHMSPGMEYLEVSEISCIPEMGELCIEPDKRHQEKFVYLYRPHMLWLDTPLSKNYPAGTIVHSAELLAKGAGALQSASLEESVDKLQSLIHSLHEKTSPGAKREKMFPDMSITQQFLKL